MGESRYLNSGGYMGYAPEIYKILTDHEIADTADDQLYMTDIYLDEYQQKVTAIGVWCIREYRAVSTHLSGPVFPYNYLG